MKKKIENIYIYFFLIDAQTIRPPGGKLTFLHDRGILRRRDSWWSSRFVYRSPAKLANPIKRQVVYSIYNEEYTLDTREAGVHFAKPPPRVSRRGTKKKKLYRHVSITVRKLLKGYARFSWILEAQNRIKRPLCESSILCDSRFAIDLRSA